MCRCLGLALLLLQAGCGGGTSPAAPDLGDTHPDSMVQGPIDASIDAPMDAEVRACGDQTCGASEHCCATCPGESDVCIPVGYQCPVADEFDCRPLDCPAAMEVGGAAVGSCDTVLGYWWAGMECQSLTGCSCSGAVCQGLFPTKAACDAAHTGCPLCGTVTHIPCGDGEFCRRTGLVQRCALLSEHWGICVPVPDSCPSQDAAVCGCDGVTYGNACLAREARQTVDHLGACQP